MHAKLQPQPHILGGNMRVESSAREFCIFPASRTFSVVGSLVKNSKKIMRQENADWIAVHASSATTTATAKFAVHRAYWSHLQDGGIQTAFFLRLRDRVHCNPSCKMRLRECVVCEMRHRVQSVLSQNFNSPTSVTLGGLGVNISTYRRR